MDKGKKRAFTSSEKDVIFTTTPKRKNSPPAKQNKRISCGRALWPELYPPVHRRGTGNRMYFYSVVKGSTRRASASRSPRSFFYTYCGCARAVCAASVNAPGNRISSLLSFFAIFLSLHAPHYGYKSRPYRKPREIYAFLAYIFSALLNVCGIDSSFHFVFLRLFDFSVCVGNVIALSFCGSGEAKLVIYLQESECVHYGDV